MLRKTCLFLTAVLLALTARRAFWVSLGENPFNKSGRTYVEFFQQLDHTMFGAMCLVFAAMLRA